MREKRGDHSNELSGRREQRCGLYRSITRSSRIGAKLLVFQVCFYVSDNDGLSLSQGSAASRTVVTPNALKRFQESRSEADLRDDGEFVAYRQLYVPKLGAM